MEALKGLYYPFSVCTNLSTLKRATLIFDEIWFVDSIDRYLREGLMHHYGYLPFEIVKEWDQIRASIEYLQDLNIVRTFDPEDLIAQNDHLLTQALESDLTDSQFIQICKSASVDRPKWIILKSRIPPSAFERLKYLHAASVKSSQLDDSSEVKRWIEIKDGFRKELAKRLPGVKLHEHGDLILGGLPDPAKASNQSDQDSLHFQYALEKHKEFWEESFLIIHTDEMHELIIPGMSGETIVHGIGVIPVVSSANEAFLFSCGSSLNLNQALLVAEREGLSCFTDSTVHHSLLQHKYQKAIANLNENSHVAQKQGYFTGLPGIIAMSILDSVIETTEIEKRSLREIIDYRNRCQKELKSFHIYVAQLAADLQNSPQLSSKEIEKLMCKEVLPKVEEICNQVSNIYDEMFGAVGKKIIKAAAGSGGIGALTATLFPSLTLGEIVTFSCTALTGALSWVIPDMIDAWIKKRKIMRHGLSYLLKL